MLIALLQLLLVALHQLSPIQLRLLSLPLVSFTFLPTCSAVVLFKPALVEHAGALDQLCVADLGQACNFVVVFVLLRLGLFLSELSQV